MALFALIIVSVSLLLQPSLAHALTILQMDGDTVLNGDINQFDTLGDFVANSNETLLGNQPGALVIRRITMHPFGSTDRPAGATVFHVECRAFLAAT